MSEPVGLVNDRLYRIFTLSSRTTPSTNSIRVISEFFIQFIRLSGIPVRLALLEVWLLFMELVLLIEGCIATGEHAVRVTTLHSATACRMRRRSRRNFWFIF